MQSRASAAGSSSRRTAVQISQDREALGLASSKPSEKIAGLEEVAKRAEKLAEREEIKRKSGGKMNANIALHVDDTGKRWQRYVLMGIFAVLVVGGAVTWLLVKKANTKIVPDRAAAAETEGILNGLARQAELMKHFDESESVTEKTVKERLKESCEAMLAKIEEDMKKDARAKRNPDPRLISDRHFMEKLMTFKDGWGKPVTVTIVENDYAEFGSSGKFQGTPIDPVKVKVRSGSTPAPEKSEEPKKKN